MTIRSCNEQMQASPEASTNQFHRKRRRKKNNESRRSRLAFRCHRRCNGPKDTGAEVEARVHRSGSPPWLRRSRSSPRRRRRPVGAPAWVGPAPAQRSKRDGERQKSIPHPQIIRNRENEKRLQKKQTIIGMREEERGGGAVRIRIRGASSRRPAWWWERDERRGKEGLGLVSGVGGGRVRVGIRRRENSRRRDGSSRRLGMVVGEIGVYGASDPEWSVYGLNPPPFSGENPTKGHYFKDESVWHKKNGVLPPFIKFK